MKPEGVHWAIEDRARTDSIWMAAPLSQALFSGYEVG
jgi:hypothetical protein